MLWNTPDGGFVVWNITDGGVNNASSPKFGPIAGWTPRKLGVGGDNLTRLLLVRSDGAIAVWTLNSDLSFGSSTQAYGPITNWNCQDMAVASDNTLRLLWSQADGTFAVWSVAANGSIISSVAFGPYSGVGGTWNASKIGVGGDSNARILIKRTDGASAVWTLNSSLEFGSSSSAFSPYTGYGASALALNTSNTTGDNKRHLMWVGGGNTAALWRLSPNDALTVPSALEVNATYGPYWTPQALSVGGDNQMRMLWTNPDGRANFWKLTPTPDSSAASIAVNVTYGPLPQPTPTPQPTATPQPPATPQPTATPAPTTPANLYAITTGSGKITLYWDAVPNAVGYYVFRSTSAGGENYSMPLGGAMVLSQASYSGSQIQMWTDTGLADGTMYFYTVKAVTSASSSGGTQSDPSNEDGDVADPTGTPWDSRNVSTILAKLETEVNAADPDGDQVESGQSFIAVGPDGAIYERGEGSLRPAQKVSGVVYTFSDGSRMATSSADYPDSTSGIRDVNPTTQGKPGGGAWIGVKATPNTYRGVSFDLQLPSKSDVVMSDYGVATHTDGAYCYLGMGGAPTTLDAGIYNRKGYWEFYLQNSQGTKKDQHRFYEHGNTGANRTNFQPGEIVRMKFYMDTWNAHISTKRNVFLGCVSLTDSDPDTGAAKGGYIVSPVDFYKMNLRSFIPKRFNQLAQAVSATVDQPIGSDAATGSYMRNIHWTNGRLFLTSPGSLPRQWNPQNTYLKQFYAGANSSIQTTTIGEDYNQVVNIQTSPPSP